MNDISSVLASRVNDLVVVRESDQSDRMLMQIMLERTMAGCRAVPGTARAVEIGLDPFDHPRLYNADLRRKAKHTMVLFELDGTLFFYTMGSAAAMEAGSLDNDYTSFLIEIIDMYQPRNIHLEGVTRLVRGAALAGALQACLERSGSILHAGAGFQIDARSPSGAMQFHLLALVSAFERDHIVMRTTAGAVALAARGGCPFMAEDLPPGYMMVDKVVRPDPAQVPQMAAFLQVLGLNLTARQKVHALSALGFTMRHLADGVDVAHSRDPKSLIRTLEQWLPLYQTGIYTVRRTNPFLGVDRIGTATVIRDHENQAGYIELHHKWGLPEGGWASPEILAAAASQVNSRKVKNGAHSHARRKPLLGLARWVDDNVEWILDSHDKAEYRLRKRPAPTDTDHHGWAEPSIDGAVVARVRAADLHQSVARGITEALSHGVGVELTSGHHIGRIGGQLHATLSQAHVTQSMRTQAQTLREQAARSRKIARTIGADASRQPWIDDALALDRQAADIDVQADRRDEQAKNPTWGEQNVAVDADLCARALARLESIETDAHRDVGDALSHLLDDLRLYPTDDGHVQWQVRVALPADSGAVLLGPITGRVQVVARMVPAVSGVLLTPTRVNTVLTLLAEGATPAELLSKVPEWSPSRMYKRISEALVHMGLPRLSTLSLLGAPIAEPRSAVVGALQHTPNPSREDLHKIVVALAIDDEHAAYLEHVLTTYLFPEHIHFPRNWAHSVTHRQELVDFIVEHGGKATLRELGEVAPALKRSELIQSLLRENETRREVRLPCAKRGQVWKNELGRRSCRRTDDSEIAAITCPHCGGYASRILQAAEVPRHLLCPDCRRAPIADSPVFPRSYIDLPPIVDMKRTPWVRGAPSIARQARDATLSDVERAQLERACTKCGDAYIPSITRQIRCTPCRLQMEKRTPST